MNDLREHTRYSLENGAGRPASVEIDGVTKLNGIVTDLSTGGFSFNIEMDNIPDSEFDLPKFIFVKINYGSFSINAEAEKKWSLVKNADGNKTFTAGVSFKIISSEDRLRLNEIIENLRSESSLQHRNFSM